MTVLELLPPIDPPQTDESRRYRILEVVGEGGFGKVYRARLEGAEGFAKDVAIKLLSDEDAPAIVLQRFRDESRILGLVRDRAVVTVDPPTRLEGRWAVVMEFVDGTNCQRLMKETPLPPRTALEVVQEVARALDNVYSQEGPDGSPLRLVHRDIKPGNIQLTPAGTVKVLDFGIARAEFAARESKTTTHIGGTFGYIAPERLHGEEGPESDVYSLGVVLMAIVAGRRSTSKNRKKILDWVEQDEDLKKVWAFAQEMSALDPADRPSAREVEDRAAILGPTLRGEPLRRWAEQHVKSYKDSEPDLLIGNVLTETMAHVPRFANSAEIPLSHHTGGSGRWRWIALALVALVCIGVGLVSAVGAGVLITTADFSGEAPSTLEAVVPPPPPAPVAQPTREVEPEPAPEPLPEQGPERAPVVAPIPVAPRPEPSPAPPPVVAEPARKKYPVSLGSVPVGAKIVLDGRSLGTRPVVNRMVTEGSHRVKMSFPDGRTASKTIRVGPDEPKRYIWKGGEQWSVHY